MFKFFGKMLGKPSKRPAWCVALCGAENEGFDTIEAFDLLMSEAEQIKLPVAEDVTLNFGEPFDRKYKSYKIVSWTKRGCPLPSTPCNSIEIMRFIDQQSRGLTDYIWYGLLSNDANFIFIIEQGLLSSTHGIFEMLALSVQSYANFDYGYCFEMDMEDGPAFYADGSTLNGGACFTPIQIQEIAKWNHARLECQKKHIPLSNYMRDVYTINLLNERHLRFQIQGEALQDWIVSKPNRGELKRLDESKELWVWYVPEKRISAIRKVLGHERLLVSWGGFSTPSGGPQGESYGAPKNNGTAPPLKFDKLAQSELQWINLGLTQLKGLIEKYKNNTHTDIERLIKDRKLFSILLDEVFSSWMHDSGVDKLDQQSAANAFATAFGEHLVNIYGMEWVKAQSDNSIDIAVIHLPSQTLTYPLDVVLKRIESGETIFFKSIIDTIGRSIVNDVIQLEK